MLTNESKEDIKKHLGALYEKSKDEDFSKLVISEEYNFDIICDLKLSIESQMKEILGFSNRHFKTLPRLKKYFKEHKYSVEKSKMRIKDIKNWVEK